MRSCCLAILSLRIIYRLPVQSPRHRLPRATCLNEGVNVFVANKILFIPTFSVKPTDFNTYGARRGHDDVMARGTFANIRLVNKMMDKAEPRTKHWPSGDEMDVFDAAERYRKENVSVLVIAGKEYGSGSSRDWAAKGPYLQVRF